MLFRGLPFCKTCASAKLYKQHKKGLSENQIIEFFRRVYANICGGGKTFSITGNKYYLILIDNAFRRKWYILLKKKFNILYKLKN